MGGYQIASTPELVTRNTAKLAADFDENQAREANAAFIVRACNAHADLLAACEAQLKCLTMDSDSEEDYAPEIEQARAAIAKARK